MLKILIVEDQVLIANHIKNILIDNGFNTIDCAFKIEVATQKLKDFNPDIILLDINVEGKDTGIEWAKQNSTHSKIIFITGQTELHTLDLALTVNPIAYLTKPVKKIDLLAALALAVKNSTPKYILIKDGYEDVKVLYDEILFIKSDKNYIDIQLLEKKYTIRKSLEAFLDEAKAEQFIKVHRSYVINRSKITKKNSKSVYINDLEIPLSRTLNFKI